LVSFRTVHRRSGTLNVKLNLLGFDVGGGEISQFRETPRAAIFRLRVAPMPMWPETPNRIVTGRAMSVLWRL
jgi:hypothetical protein